MMVRREGVKKWHNPQHPHACWILVQQKNDDEKFNSHKCHLALSSSISLNDSFSTPLCPQRNGFFSSQKAATALKKFLQTTYQVVHCSKLSPRIFKLILTIWWSY